jgi:hypothetical protein
VAVCDRLGRGTEAERFLALAQRLWNRADPDDFNRLKNILAAKASRLPTAASASSPTTPSQTTP